MPDAWVDPTSGEVVGAGWSLLAGSFLGERAVDALPRGCAAIIVLRFLMDRPACVDALPLLEISGSASAAVAVFWPRPRAYAMVIVERRLRRASRSPWRRSGSSIVDHGRATAASLGDVLRR
jgi:hypothetical protein